MDTRAARVIVFAGMCIPSVHADTMPIESGSPPSESRPGLLTQDRLTAAAASRTEFLMTHGNYAQTRFHRADRVNRETVKNLKMVTVPPRAFVDKRRPTSRRRLTNSAMASAGTHPA